MTKAKLVTIICSAISALALIGLVIWMIVAQPTVFGFNIGGVNIGGINIENLGGTFYPRSTENINAAGIDYINVDWVAGEVRVVPHDRNYISIVESAQRELDNNEQMSVRVSASGVTVSFIEGRRIGRMPPKNLEILVPFELSEQLDRLGVEAISAAILVSDLTANTAAFSSISGRLELDNMNAQSLSANSTSGRVEISSTSAGRLNVSSVSGSLTLRDVVTDVLSSNTVSGSSAFSGSLSSAEFESVSGAVTVTSDVVPLSFDVSTVSGAVNLTIPNEGSISISHTAVSGRLHSEIPMTTARGNAQFIFSSVSGNVNIHELR